MTVVADARRALAERQAAAALMPAAIAVSKLESGEKLTDEETAVLNETLTRLGRPDTGLAKVLEVASQSASFGVELATTYGIYSGVKELALKGAESGLKKNWHSQLTHTRRSAPFV